MAPAPDPFERYLNEAAALFEAGDVVKAGQIWQAILKRDPNHGIARAGLYKVKVHFDARATQDGLFVPPLPELPAAEPAQSLELSRLLDLGCTLYDDGRREEAISAWTRVQDQDPGNILAKGYIEGARRQMEAEAVRTGALATLDAQAADAQAQAAEAEAQDTEASHERLLRDGCTLFDMGQSEDALRKWERILAEDPQHGLALAYANDARKELGLAPLQPGEARPAQAVPPAAAPEGPEDPGGQDSRLDRMVRDGVQLYDMGMPDVAMEKWQEVLDLDPGHRDAAGYLEMANRERAQEAARASAAPPPAAQRAPAPPPPSPAETQIQLAQQLLRSQRYDEAAKAFQDLLERQPNDPRVLQGYQQARAILAAREPVAKEPATQALDGRTPDGRTAIVPGEANLESVPPAPVAVAPPRALTNRAAPQRAGIQVPHAMQHLAIPPWLLVPRNLAMAAGLLVVLLTAGYFIRDHQREVALRQAVAAAKADAMKPVVRQTQIANLAETPEGVRKEAEASLAEDPLLAYCRAQEWLRLDPGNAAAAQLMDRAKTQMAALPPAGTITDFDKQVQDRDLESAANTIQGLLRQTPDDPELRTKARMVYLGLVQFCAGKERFAEARDCLLRGRALFPHDKTWQGKLKLLETIQGMAKGERAGWIQMLG